MDEQWVNSKETCRFENLTLEKVKELQDLCRPYFQVSKGLEIEECHNKIRNHAAFAVWKQTHEKKTFYTPNLLMFVSYALLSCNEFLMNTLNEKQRDQFKFNKE